MTAPRVPEHDIHALFTDRWSPRAFTAETIPADTLRSFLEAARWAPSAFNAQPWRFVYALRDGEGWDALLETLSPDNRVWAQRGSALVAILSRKTWTPPGLDKKVDNHSHAFDAGAAWASLALQATLAGWHTRAIGGLDRKLAHRLLGIPEDHAVQAVAAIGRQADKSVLPPTLQAREHPSERKPLQELANEGRFAFGD
jgi:nitroreductase